MMKLLKNIMMFVVVRKKYWLIPLIAALLVLAMIIGAVKTAPVAPAIYPIF